ncbi:MAG: hypothetical protein IKU71_01730 [Kiritimatiellae bacterium]|nr:hypothetical protein [Kiritimatiellia bacterium]
MRKIFILHLSFLVAVLSAFCGQRDVAMMSALMRMELAGQVVAEAQKMSDIDEVSDAAGDFRSDMFAAAREGLVAAFADAGEAQSAFASFVDAVRANPSDYAKLRAEVANGVLVSDIAAAGKFLGDVQSWLRLRGKGEVPPLEAWLARDSEPSKPSTASGAAAESADVRKPKKKKKRNPLRDAEAEAGTFVEAPDDGGSVLQTFGTARKERRRKALAEAEAGMAQVQSERRIADEEYNAKKQAAAAAEAAAMQAQAQKLAAAEQEAVAQDQNSWKTRIKSIVGTAVGAAGSAFLGNIGSRVGEEAARAILDDRPRR